MRVEESMSARKATERTCTRKKVERATSEGSGPSTAHDSVGSRCHVSVFQPRPRVNWPYTMHITGMSMPAPDSRFAVAIMTIRYLYLRVLLSNNSPTYLLGYFAHCLSRLDSGPLLLQLATVYTETPFVMRRMSIHACNAPSIGFVGSNDP